MERPTDPYLQDPSDHDQGSNKIRILKNLQILSEILRQNFSNLQMRLILFLDISESESPHK